jgi:hypothetical protein
MAPSGSIGRTEIDRLLDVTTGGTQRQVVVGPPRVVDRASDAARGGVEFTPMHGYVAVTDPGWCERLSRTPGPKDANFWRPSARPFARLEAGAPFLFKLKAPHNAIAG